MITSYKEIKSHNKINEIWNYINLFQDIEYTKNRMIQYLNISEEDQAKHKDNIVKQAKQIKLSIQQAREYFLAAESVSIVTKPLMIYYGFSSLSRALILFKKNGTYSYDSLRQSDKHNHHGLNLKKDFSSSKKSELIDSLLDFRCSINLNNSLPWGNFGLYYEVLDPDATLIRGIHQFEGSGLQGHIHQLVNCCDKKDILSYPESILNLKDLILNLSDMHDYLKNKGYRPNIYYGNMLKNTLQKICIRANGNIVQQDTVIDYVFLLSGVRDPEVRKWFIDEYKNRGINFTELTDTDFSAKITETIKLNEKESLRNLPETVNAFNGNMYYVYKPEKYIFESASFYIISFILSMICRYHPDIWIEKLEKVNGFSELISYLLDIMQVKIPNLILNQITDTLYVFD